MKRRTFIGHLAAASLAAALPDPTTDLKRAAARAGLLSGTCVSRRELTDSAFTPILAEQASTVVCENEMKWGLIHPQPGVFDFSGGDALMQFAEAHGQKLRGHNLCWHEQLPSWFGSTATPANTEELLRLHIATVAGHYKGRVQSWDVVNEAIQVKDKQPGGYRDSIWYRNLGPRFIEVAFRAAADADPHAILTYNDYDIEQTGDEYQAKRDAVVAMLRSLRDKDVPVQAIGLQSHLTARTEPERWDQLHRFIQQIEELGLQVFVTELDVNDQALPTDVAARDAAVARLYAEYLTNVLQHKSVRAVLTWGLTDRDSWLIHYRPRKDGQSPRPLPFDSDLKPKPAYFAMLNAFQNAPPR